MTSKYSIPADLDLHPDHQPIPDPVDPPARLLASKAFRDWFQGSTVTGADGKPLMVFHGTAREDREFRSSRHYDLEGAYFTDCFKVAKDLAYMDSEIDCEQPYVISAFIRLSNPYAMDDFDSQVISTQQANDLKAAGHDGVIGVNADTGLVSEYVVFDPAQIAQFHEGKVNIPDRYVAPAKSNKDHDESPSP